ncbi:MAG: ABC transporter substrate-binding protein [Lachnospiraceae bacterium]|nr:ABC transporter substrate-binding protein [Lachnospiraceae bacterium]MDY5742778.1 ABC transporter substrate-binding protein [Lachnospiraceae bacterium]
MKKRWIALTLVAMTMTGLLAGCGQKKADTTKSGTKSEADAGKKDLPVLKWVTVGGGKPDNYDAWQKKVNDYIGPKIGAHVDVDVISWGDWDAKRNTIVTANEPFDLIFGNGGTFAKDVKLGALADITEFLGADSKLKKLIPADYWKALTIDGKCYGVPTYKDSSITQYFVWDKAMLDKYEVKDFEKINSLEAAEPVLKKITDGEKKASFPLAKTGVYQILDTYDSFGLGLPFIGVKYNDKTGKVVNKLEQADVQAELAALKKMFDGGVINQDAFTTAEVQPAGTICSIAQGWPMAAKTAWGPARGAEAVVSRYTPTMLNNDSVLGSVNSVSANSKHKKEAVALLELINDDSKLRDMFFYGEPDVDFKYVDGKVERINKEWKMAGYTQGTFFNVTQTVDTKENQWDEVKKLNEEAEPSVLLGFQLDNSSIEAQIANMTQIWASDSAELLTGVKDPKTAIEEINKKMKEAGMDDVIKECQKQVDAFLAK